MQIDLSFDSSTDSAPSGFRTAMQSAAQILDTLITNNITVTINVGWGEIGGHAITGGTLAEGGALYGTNLTEGQLVSDLSAHGNSTTAQALAALPANAASQLPGSMFVASAQEKAWGLIAPNASQADGQIGFNSAEPYSFDPNNQSVPGEFGIIGPALHEMTHALGRLNGDGALDLAEYTAPGTLATPIANHQGNPGYFSLDGGTTQLAQFDATDADPGDWSGTNAAHSDAFAQVTQPGINGGITAVDQQELAVLGYNIAPSPGQFQVADVSAGTSSTVDGQAIGNAAAGVQWQLIYAQDPSNLAVTPFVPDTFVRTGSGNDVIDVSKVNGNNILDGGTGGNMLIGGSGQDTFYVDDRAPAAQTWSTVENFHAGDAVTVWGVTPQDFSIDWANGLGAPNAPGLTAQFTAPNQPGANVTLAGYTGADLSNGRLAVSFGQTASQAGIPGSPYMQIVGT